MDTTDKLIEQIRANGDDVWIAGPQSEEAVAVLETKLGVHLPPSYRAFILRFGALGILESVVSGIIDNAPLARKAGTLYWETERYRSEHALPANLLVVQADEDEPYCINTRTAAPDGEFPLVSYDLQSRHATRLAPSFGAWFAEWLRLQADEDA
jgi:hypothetical protein